LDEVGFALGQRFKLFAIVEFALVACAINHPDVFAFAAVDSRVGACLGEKPLRKGAHGGDAGSGGNKNRIGDGLFQHEVPMRSVDANGAAWRQIGEIGEVI